jgi:hypothetical protein
VARILGLALAIVLLAAGPATAAVLYVGDSLGVGTAPYLRDDLGGTALAVDAEIGRPSGVGVDVLRSSIGPEHDVVVFDLGTNDDPAAPEALAADLTEARAIAGDRCLVVATLNRPPLNGVSVDGLNRAVTRFAARDAGVELVDWHGAAAADPGLLFDGVHASPDGYALRASLFADAIGACLAFGGAGSGVASDPTPPAGLEHEPDAELPAPQPPSPQPRSRRPDPLHALALEVAKAISVGAEFG